ncbi:MAG: hypothetical protein MRY77_07625 [Rhodobacteraceae bacterium]|nr:hypothetical protein [Paracoccaceae bacterium]
MTAAFSDSFPLRPTRVHEACGPGAYGFAALSAAQTTGPLMWVRENWRTETLNPVSLAQYCDPSRLLMVQAANQTDVLAVAEEALRDGAVPLVVLELTQPLTLTTGRRLQLAAKDGRATGLCLIPDGMGSNAAETRWRCTPVFDSSDSTLMRWDLIKNKSGTLGVWHVRWDQSAHRIRVVPPAGKRPGSTPAPA